MKALRYCCKNLKTEMKMISNRDFNTLIRVLKRIVTDSDKQDAYETLGEPLFNSAVEFLDERGQIERDERAPQFDDHVTITVPWAVAEAYWRSIGAFHPLDVRAASQQGEVASPRQ
jgi:hypothetical protein